MTNTSRDAEPRGFLGPEVDAVSETGRGPGPVGAAVAVAAVSFAVFALVGGVGSSLVWLAWGAIGLLAGFSLSGST